MKCPICDGRGEIHSLRPLDKTKRAELAFKLHKTGLSIRKVAELMRYKSPRSVSELLEKHKTVSIK